MTDIMELEETLLEDTTMTSMVKQLSRVHGKSVNSVLQNVMNILMANIVMARYNLRGKCGKLRLVDTNTYKMQRCI